MDYKELTIEQKAKRYDEILARAKGANIPYYKEDIMLKVKEFVDYLLPELKYSEDEEIRYYLINFVKINDGVNLPPDDAKKAIAWLEKQGGKIDIVNKGYWRGYREGKQEIIDKYSELEKQGEPKPADKVEPKFKVGDIIRPKGSLAEYIIESISGGCYHGKGWGLSIGCEEDYELVEQKHVEWSEEDKKMIGKVLECIRFAEDHYQLEDESGGTDVKLWLLDHINSQPKQEWSEEDERMLQHTLSTIRYALSIPISKEDDSGFAGSSTISWLKSLKQRMKGEII